ncbi:hypothetical protein C8J57DRAFT_976256, partial [Mycena rebaudengoi]
IAARFDGASSAERVVPGCAFHARWPAGYADVYFGANNCLYHSGGQNIDGQCCEAGTGGALWVLNPY